MAWFTWQQYRRTALIGAAALALAAVVVLGIGLKMGSDYQDSGLAACVAAGDHASRCSDIGNGFAQQYGPLTYVLTLGLVVLALLLGMFAGTPLLVQELDRGTHRLAWTQSISRARWAVIKLALLAVGVALAAAAVSVVGWWWHRPLDQLFGGPFAGFDIEGITPIAYSLFAFALGVTAGLLTRSVVLGLGITLVTFAGLRVLVAQFVRPYYMPPLKLTWDTSRIRTSIDFNSADPTQPLAWGAGPNDLSVAFNGDWRFGGEEHGALVSFLYQPAGRFWAFQAIETAIFLGLAVLLLALAVWWVRTRVT